MTTRTLTKTKTRAETSTRKRPKAKEGFASTSKRSRSDPDELASGTSDDEDDRPRKNSKGDAVDIGSACDKGKGKNARRESSFSQNSKPAPLADSEEDDDFTADLRAEVEEDLKHKEAVKANGGKQPRKKKDAKTQQADTLTIKTRLAHRKGQDREDKTGKWALRERRHNPLIALLDIELEVVPSDSDSSEGSVNSDNVGELSDESRRIYRSRRKVKLKQQQAKYAASNGPAKKSTSSDEDKKPTRAFAASDKGKGREHVAAVKRESDGSATEDSEDEGPSRLVKKEASRDDWRFMEVDEEDKKPHITKMDIADYDSDMSDDVSPVDTEAYHAQLTRRAMRGADAKARADRRPLPSKVVASSTIASSSMLPSVKQEDGARPSVFAHSASVKRETVELGDSDNDDEGSVPDLPPTDPRYIAWARRCQEALTAAQVPAQPFAPSRQKHARPHFDIKSPQQAAMGACPLGTDEHGKAVSVPASINRFLRSYQRDGVKFFWEHYRKGEGALLGDDMGLGKTIQVISFLASIMHHDCTEGQENRRMELIKRADAPVLEKPTDLGPTALIIVPASVVDNWAREIETWTYLSADIYKPGQEKTQGVLKRFKRGRLDIMITGTDTARTRIDDLCHLDFSCIFIDEVHRVKNPLSKTSIAFQQFECKRRYGLTGTAVQNRYSELHTILGWCAPGRLGTRSQWRDYVETPLKDGQRKDATQRQLATGRTRAIALVQHLLPHFFLRRTKDLIADQLPRKFDKIVFCPLTEDQRQAYRKCLSHEEVQIILTHDEPCPCGRIDECTGLPYQRGKCCEEEWYKPILKWITIFCKIANHSVLIYPNKRDRFEQPLKYAQDQEITRFAFQDSYKDKAAERTASGLGDLDKKLCGKWPVLADLLKLWKAQGDKVLLFSRSTRLLDALEYWIEEQAYNMVRLDGSVDPSKRLELCDRFNDSEGGKFLFLISTLAGGVGLNLTAANRVVIFDPNWNPTSDLQAMDRSYRWGQTRDVYVYRLVGAGSIEELIYTRQIYKQHQAEIAYDAAAPSRMFMGVQGDKNQRGELFGVKNLFRLNESASRTKRSIEEAQITELSYALLNHAAQQKQKSVKGKKKKGDADDSSSDADDVLQNEEGSSNNDAVLAAMTKGGPIATEEDDEISRILKNNGINYTHQHSALVKQSAIEASISKEAMRNYRDIEEVDRASNQRASTARKKPQAKNGSWAPSKGKSGKVVKQEVPDTDPFETLFSGGDVKSEDLSDLAEALDFKSTADMARAFARMDHAGQAELLNRAKVIVEVRRTLAK